MRPDPEVTICFMFDSAEHECFLLSLILKFNIAKSRQERQVFVSDITILPEIVMHYQFPQCNTYSATDPMGSMC